MPLDPKTMYYAAEAAVRKWDDFTNPTETRRRIHVIFDDIFEEVRLRDALFLDAGCGGGNFSAAAAAAGARVVALDVAESLLLQARDRAGLTPVVGSTLQLPFVDDVFDVVLSTEVIEHTPDPLGAVRELCRVTARGGLLVITTPSPLWWPAVQLANRLGARHYGGHENFVWPSAVRRVSNDAGVEVLCCFGFNLLPLFSPITTRFHSVLDKAPLPASGFVNFAVVGRKS